MKKIIGALVPVLCVWTMSTAVLAQERSGSWTMLPADQAGMVHFTVVQRLERGTTHNGTDWPVSAFQGLDLATRARHDVRFTIARDAGRFDGEGYLTNGEGAGVFEFTPDPGFVRAMSDVGFRGIDEDEQFAMALHDVSLDFAREMKSENLRGMDSDKLIAFRIFGVSQEFIGELRSAGLTATDVDKLVAFRIHGVSPQAVREFRSAGIDADEDELIAFQIHGVTPQFISDMQARGLKDLSADKLVALRIHGID